MDLEKIERALEGCVPIQNISHENYCDALLEEYGPDLLRLVRAMRWMADGGVSIEQIEEQMTNSTQPRAT